MTEQVKETKETNDNGWYSEQINDGFKLSYQREENSEVRIAKSKWQQYELLESIPFGKCLVIDHLLNSSAMDEWAYHESLLHPSLCVHPAPKNILILGGGEGGSLRESLKHPSVQTAKMVDIDEQLVKDVYEWMPEWSAGAYEDKRSEVVFRDAWDVVNEADDESFDIIICDLNEPLEGNPCSAMYTKEFYMQVNKKLKPGGIFTTQAGCASIWLVLDEGESSEFSSIYATMCSVFHKAIPYSVYLPSFADEWGYLMAFKNNDGDIDSESYRRYQAIDANPWIVNDYIKECPDLEGSLRYYDAVAHNRMFSILKPIRQLLESDTKIITLKDPLYLEFNQGICVEGIKTATSTSTGSIKVDTISTDSKSSG